MLQKQRKWIFIVTLIIFTEVLSQKCMQYRKGNPISQWRTKGYFVDKDIEFHSQKFCNKYETKSIFKFHLHLFSSCKKKAAKYLQIVGENVQDIESYAIMCLKQDLDWSECLDIMSDLAKKCWDMLNVTYLFQLINDKKLIMSLPTVTIEVSYTKVLYMKNFEPKLCMKDIMGSLTVRYAFENNYYKWFQSNPTAKGCDCKKVITLYYKYKKDGIPLDTNIFSRECL
ncbi:uncharacterized protein LOC142333200 isoform X2 [Lycorma delicatula]|uniref:uncharacterized protein LOC142333200 isoform X2 n=1 Tax=Lycorma delicatula TaxID=130591 RepID=UPI003F5160E5